MVQITFTASASQNDTNATVTFNLNVPDMLTMVFNCGMTMEATNQTALYNLLEIL